jgi:hypothetical protein
VSRKRCPECKRFIVDTCPRCGQSTDTERFWANVNIKGPDECWPWQLSLFKRTGYGQCNFRGRKRSAHTVAYELSADDYDPTKMVDHKCHYEPCCNPRHLRMATNKQNLENRRGPNANSTTGVRGVRFTKGRWYAEVKHNYRTIFVGSFATKREARRAVMAKRRELFTHA